MSQSNIPGFLNKSYPFDLGLRKRFILALWTGLTIFLFIQTAALPACLGPLRVELDVAHAMLCTLA